jgi:uncharacterized membrane protein YgcG
MTDPVCDSKMHYFHTPLVDGEKCLCGFAQYDAETEYHHKPHDTDDDPMIESGGSSPSGFGGFGGGQSGGGGASGGW